MNYFVILVKIIEMNLVKKKYETSQLIARFCLKLENINNLMEGSRVESFKTVVLGEGRHCFFNSCSESGQIIVDAEVLSQRVQRRPRINCGCILLRKIVAARQQN